MTTNELKEALLWCIGINYGVLLVWFGVFVFAHDGMYRLHTRWFKLSVEAFDALHYAGMSVYKIGVILLNLVPLIALLLATGAPQLRPVSAQTEPSVLRGRALEIVDVQGRVRASINVLPPGGSPNGDDAHETVLLRLNTERGRPSVKIGASEPVSGLSFAGPTGTKDTYVILQAKGTASSLRLRNEGGHEQVLGP